MAGYFNDNFSRADFYVNVVVAAVPVVIAAWRELRTQPRISDWERAHGFRLTNGARQTAGRVLVSGRRARTIGFIVGWLVPPVFHLLAHDTRRRLSGEMLYPVVGYLAADLYADWPVRRSNAAGGASLERRRVSDYMPTWIVWGLRVVPVVVAAVVLQFSSAPDHRVERYDGHPSAHAVPVTKPGYINVFEEPVDVARDVQVWLAQTAALGALVAVSELTRRWIVVRRQQSATEEQRAIDDAFRSDAVHRVTGCTALAVLIIGYSILTAIARRTTTPDYTFIEWLGLPFPLLLAFFVGWCNPLIGWRVRRRVYGTVPTT